MKRILASAVIAAFTLALPAAAQQTAIAGSSSGATSGSSSLSGSQASSNNSIYIDQRAPSSTDTTITTRQSGTNKARVEAAPSLGSLALGGGHPCAFSPATAQVSIIGGAGGFGGMQIDEACMLMLMGAQGVPGAQQAAMNAIAARDRNACKAMYQAGMVSDCTDKRGKSYVKAAPAETPKAKATRTAAATPSVAFDVECRRENGKVTPVTSRKVMDTYGREAVMNVCR